MSEKRARSIDVGLMKYKSKLPVKCELPFKEVLKRKAQIDWRLMTAARNVGHDKMVFGHPRKNWLSIYDTVGDDLV